MASTKESFELLLAAVQAQQITINALCVAMCAQSDAVYVLLDKCSVCADVPATLQHPYRPAKYCDACAARTIVETKSDETAPFGPTISNEANWSELKGADSIRDVVWNANITHEEKHTKH